MNFYFQLVCGHVKSSLCRLQIPFGPAEEPRHFGFWILGPPFGFEAHCGAEDLVAAASVCPSGCVYFYISQFGKQKPDGYMCFFFDSLRQWEATVKDGYCHESLELMRLEPVLVKPWDGDTPRVCWCLKSSGYQRTRHMVMLSPDS